MYASDSAGASAGTTPSIGAHSPGFVPHDTIGPTALPSIVTVAAYSASVVRRAAPSSRAGAPGVAARYAAVVSSDAISPVVAPASIAMLHSVMRCSIVSARIAEPVYSST